jgi:hypothetical protein
VARKKNAKESESTSEGIRREFALARKRLGIGPVSELRWMIDFSRINLAEQSQGRVADLGWEYAAFSFDKMPAQPIDLQIRRLDQKDGRFNVPVEEMDKFQSAIQQGLGAFFTGNGWEMTQPEVFVRLKADKPPFTFESVKHRQPRRLRYAFNLIKAEWERLRSCRNPKCGAWFVVEKKGRGLYCRPRCSNYVRVTVHRAKAEFQTRPEYPKLTGRKRLEAWRDLLYAKLGIQNDEALFATIGNGDDTHGDH